MKPKQPLHSIPLLLIAVLAMHPLNAATQPNKVVTGGAAAASGAGAPAKRPNILFLFADDWAYHNTERTETR